MTAAARSPLTGSVTGVLVVLISMVLASCSDDTEPAPIPDSTSSTSESTVVPTDDEPSWEDDYTDKQLATYEDALARWTEYETKSEAIYAAGKATAEAEELFKEYYPSPVWESKFQALQAYERGNVRTDGLPTVRWSKATKVTENSATIRQCVDYTSVQTTQDGKRLDAPAEPQVRDIHLSKPGGHDFLIYQETFRFKGEVKPCKP